MIRRVGEEKKKKTGKELGNEEEKMKKNVEDVEETRIIQGIRRRGRRQGREKEGAEEDFWGDAWWVWQLIGDLCSQIRLLKGDHHGSSRDSLYVRSEILICWVWNITHQSVRGKWIGSYHVYDLYAHNFYIFQGGGGGGVNTLQLIITKETNDVGCSWGICNLTEGFQHWIWVRKTEISCACPSLLGMLMPARYTDFCYTIFFLLLHKPCICALSTVK